MQAGRLRPAVHPSPNRSAISAGSELSGGIQYFGGLIGKHRVDVDPANFGGDLTLKIEVFDWGAPSNPSGIDGEIDSIDIESNTLFDGVVSVPVSSSPGSQSTSGIYQITVPGVHPSNLDNQEILITVKSKSPTTYEPPTSGPIYPKNAVLAAYTLVKVPISNIKPPTNYIHVDVPNGGEVWDGGSSQEIKWTSVGDTGANVDISYQLVSGPIIVIVPSTPNNGSYIWNPIPNIDSSTLKVRIESIDKPQYWDESDNYFTIKPSNSIQVTSPNGGETLSAGGTWDMTWNAPGSINNVKIDLSLDGGSTYPQTIVASTPNTGDFTWNPIPDLSTSNAKIKISDASDASVFDESDNVFSIVQVQDSLTVIQPNGGETLQPGGSYEIKWSSTGNISDVMILLSTDSGQTFPTTITLDAPNTGSYVWDPIPDLDTSTARIRVSTKTIPMKSDDSDADFTIANTPPSITVIQPNGGEQLLIGGSYEIKWSWTGNIANVKIDLSLDSGGTYPISVTASTPCNGSFVVDPIPNFKTDTARIKISNVDDTSVFDTSDADFSVVPQVVNSITVTQPNGGESITGRKLIRDQMELYRHYKRCYDRAFDRLRRDLFDNDCCIDAMQRILHLESGK